jgi:hypothetical protein
MCCKIHPPLGGILDDVFWGEIYEKISKKKRKKNVKEKGSKIKKNKGIVDVLKSIQKGKK